jgi:hypothetical protein
MKKNILNGRIERSRVGTIGLLTDGSEGFDLQAELQFIAERERSALLLWGRAKSKKSVVVLQLRLILKVTARNVLTKR